MMPTDYRRGARLYAPTETLHNHAMRRSTADKLHPPESLKVTVLIPVYNREKYVVEAIDRVLTQTFMDFELLVIDDGSTDGSVEIGRFYSDPRLSLCS